MNYYIADTHFGHRNIMHLDARPFKTTEEMWQKMKDLWNSRVKDTDDVWIIGDFCFRSGEKPEYYLKQLKGKKHLIIGNHDVDLLKDKNARAYFESIDYYKKIHDNGKTIILCHYPIAEWDGFFKGNIHIYAHIHNNQNDAYHIMKKYENALNAGCMINNYMPVTLQELIDNNKAYNSIPSVK
jgi:calcineurin-like phosphoesterase family protein